MQQFRVGVSHDFQVGGGTTTSWGDIGLAVLDDDPAISWRYLEPDDGVLTPEHLHDLDAVLFGSPAVTADSLQGVEDLLLLARFGVGFDAVDVAACTAAGVAVTITPDGARRPVAAAALALILALTHRLVVKDRMVRDGSWQDRLAHNGTGLSGATVGTVGYGNVARELFRLLAPFGTTHLAADPYRSVEEVACDGVHLLPLDELMARSDIVVVTTALTPETRHLLGPAQLALLRPSAYLVNIARGAIVDEAALVDALTAGRLAGAALDVFDCEPLPTASPLVRLQSTVLSPHCLAWTDEMARGNGASALRAVRSVAAGTPPEILVDPGIVHNARFCRGLRRWASRR